MGAAAGAWWTWSRDPVPDHDPDPRDPATRTRDTGVRGAGSTGAPSAQGVQTRGTCCMPGWSHTTALEPTLCGVCARVRASLESPFSHQSYSITQLKRIQKQEKKGEDKLEGRIRERKKVAHVA